MNNGVKIRAKAAIVVDQVVKKGRSLDRAMDKGNLDKDSGGMIIWKKKPDKMSNFSDYNSSFNSEKMLRDVSKADFIKIPYKSNRAIIFNSKLYHATDNINFDSKYINRRINVTFLYS